MDKKKNTEELVVQELTPYVQNNVFARTQDYDPVVEARGMMLKMFREQKGDAFLTKESLFKICCELLTKKLRASEVYLITYGSEPQMRIKYTAMSRICQRDYGVAHVITNVVYFDDEFSQKQNAEGYFEVDNHTVDADKNIEREAVLMKFLRENRTKISILSKSYGKSGGSTSDITSREDLIEKKLANNICATYKGVYTQFVMADGSKRMIFYTTDRILEKWALGRKGQAPYHYQSIVEHMRKTSLKSSITFLFDQENPHVVSGDSESDDMIDVTDASNDNIAREPELNAAKENIDASDIISENGIEDDKKDPFDRQYFDKFESELNTFKYKNKEILDTLEEDDLNILLVEKFNSTYPKNYAIEGEEKKHLKKLKEDFISDILKRGGAVPS